MSYQQAAVQRHRLSYLLYCSTKVPFASCVCMVPGATKLQSHVLLSPVMVLGFTYALYNTKSCWSETNTTTGTRDHHDAGPPFADGAKRGSGKANYQSWIGILNTNSNSGSALNWTKGRNTSSSVDGHVGIYSAIPIAERGMVNGADMHRHNFSEPEPYGLHLVLGHNIL